MDKDKQLYEVVLDLEIRKRAYVFASNKEEAENIAMETCIERVYDFPNIDDCNVEKHSCSEIEVWK